MEKQVQTVLFAVEVISVLIFEICFSVKEAHFCCEMYQMIRNNFLVNNMTKNALKIQYMPQKCIILI